MSTAKFLLCLLAGVALGEAFKACPAHAGNNDVEQITSELRQLRQTEQAQTRALERIGESLSRCR